MEFRRGVGAILITICVPPAWNCAQLLAQDSTPHWVPFVAKLVEEEVHKPPGGMSVHVTIAGVFVRNSRGVLYRRMVASVGSDLPVQGLSLDTADLHDRPHRIRYEIDYVNKTIKRESDPSGDPDFAVGPMSRADFDRRHAADLSLGKQIVAGVECEGYKLSDPRHKGKYRGEAWFAPSVDFLLVRYSGRLSSGAAVTLEVKDLEPGKEPDPSFFRLPEGFKLVK